MLTRGYATARRAIPMVAPIASAMPSHLSMVPNPSGRKQKGSGRGAIIAAGVATCVAAGALCEDTTPEIERTVETPAFSSRPTVLFVLGGPGAGKGTQCAKLVSECGFVHLSAGDLLRAEQSSGSADGDLIRRYIKEGQIVPVEITVGLLAKAMQASGCSKFLIDGFPRNEDNFNGWKRVMSDSVDVDGVLFYDVDDATRLERLLERGKTSGRTDDNADTIRKRFRVFAEQTMPIVKHYEAQGKTFHIDAAPAPDTVFKATLHAVRPTLERDVVASTQHMLDAIDSGDFEAYAAMCDPAMTAIEDETHGAVVKGLDFHRFYFDAAASRSPAEARRSAILNPSVRLLGAGSAVIAYTRAVQTPTKTVSVAETRVMEQRGGRWVCVHFHRSPAGSLPSAAQSGASEATAAFDREAAAVEASILAALRAGADSRV